MRTLFLPNFAKFDDFWTHFSPNYGTIAVNVRFSKRSKILFFEKVDWFFRKKNMNFSKSLKVADLV